MRQNFPLQFAQIFGTIFADFERMKGRLLMDEKIKWVVKSDYADKNRFKKYGKKHHDEVVSCTENLERLEKFLNNGGTLQQAMTFGYFGSEGHDVYRIGQTGLKSAKETRLYIYAKIVGSEIQVLTIGDKDTQKEDIKNCKAKAKILCNKDNNTNATTQIQQR